MSHKQQDNRIRQADEADEIEEMDKSLILKIYIVSE